MNLLARIKPYLPLAARVATTVAAALSPVALAVSLGQPVGNEVLAAAFVAGSAAWKRWHPSASLSTLSTPEPPADAPAEDVSGTLHTLGDTFRDPASK